MDKSQHPIGEKMDEMGETEPKCCKKNNLGLRSSEHRRTEGQVIWIDLHQHSMEKT